MKESNNAPGSDVLVQERAETNVDNGQRNKKSADKSAEATAKRQEKVVNKCEKLEQKEQKERLARPRSGRDSEEGQKILSRSSELKTEDIDRAELQEVYKNAVLGMQSVEDLRPLSRDRAFRNLLLKQYGRYAAVAKDVEIYAADRGMELDDPSLFAKGMMKISTVFNTVKDRSNSKLAEIMVQGINMGIVSITKVINRLADEHRTNEYADRMLEHLQENLNEMKVFL